MLKNGDHCTSPQSIDFAVMEVKECDEIYNVVADQKYPDCITKNQKDALRNKAKKFAIRDGLLYYLQELTTALAQLTIPKQTDKMRGSTRPSKEAFEK